MTNTLNKLKYDEFYYSAENKVLPFNALNKSNYKTYEHQMFCPDCQEAKLHYVYNTKTPHLKQKPNASHKNHCPYQYIGASKESIKRHFDTLTDEQIGYKLDSMIRYLCTDKNTREAYLTDEPTRHTPMLIENIEKATRTYTALKRKSLGAYFTDEDMGEIYVFYGKVKLELDIVNKDDKTTYAFIKILIGKKAISIYLPFVPNDIDKEREYYIVCIGYLAENLFKIKLLKPNCLKYQRV
ncbi:hypothetical protein JE036_07215 [Campylobacter upsaliensis]|uniref:hypothetical protein n=1 Tax=Campylobacter upsaliensis TaxID=28080 RepID=UPI0018F0F7B8|nr:hypothetical protein [Campylobacter upsaliensis]MBJ6707596.1 hypothetical protein [Campylobacter upsaliensis]